MLAAALRKTSPLKKGMKTGNGFTLIELIVVIVIIGILAALAVPRFIDLQGRAQQSVRDGLTSNLRLMPMPPSTTIPPF
jgi:prepilin-type N-terminal cleavage/methylation domain-containing protein